MSRDHLPSFGRLQLHQRACCSDSGVCLDIQMPSSTRGCRCLVPCSCLTVRRLTEGACIPIETESSCFRCWCRSSWSLGRVVVAISSVLVVSIAENSNCIRDRLLQSQKQEILDSGRPEILQHRVGSHLRVWLSSSQWLIRYWVDRTSSGGIVGDWWYLPKKHSILCQIPKASIEVQDRHAPRLSSTSYCSILEADHNLQHSLHRVLWQSATDSLY